MALLADGFHMASHASALTISAFAYYYTRRHARDDRFNFGTGKVNSLAGKYFGLTWLDPCMGLVGAVLVIRWSWGLLHASAHVLLDMQAPQEFRTKIKEAIEAVDDNRVADLHVWSVGADIYAAKIVIVSSHPLTIEEYHNLLPKDFGLVHQVVEIRVEAANLTTCYTKLAG
jgi:Co/Zn/Cd efflux system component